MSDTDKAVTHASGKELHLGWALVLISVAQLMVVLDGTIVTSHSPTSSRTSRSTAPT